MKISALTSLQLLMVRAVVGAENVFLSVARKLLFLSLAVRPQNILIYKVGNIGDIACAIPSFIAIRRAFPDAKITLLTSPGKKGAVGATDFLSGAWYMDEMKVYYAEDIGSISKIRSFIRALKAGSFDLFIQLPDDLANVRTMLRNMIFAKLLGARRAIGFKIRTIRLFKNAQVDYLTNKTEVESLLDILKQNDIPVQKVEFDFPINPFQKEKIKKILREKWGHLAKDDILIAISPGGKRETNRWPLQRFREVAEHLSKNNHARIVIVGGKDDIPLAKEIVKNIPESDVFIACGKIALLETAELLRHCTLLISNSTGTIHLAAAVGLPAVGLYGVRDAPGRWFPYGSQHKILHHEFFDCDYGEEKCIQKSIGSITVSEAIFACDKLINERKMPAHS